MKITFIGTRANIKHRSNDHMFNASCIISHRSTHILIDCGTDLADKLATIHPVPDGILVTHAHPDHVGGLKKETRYPVYALKESFNLIPTYHIHQRHVIKPRQPFVIGAITIEAFRVEHAITASAVGYRITAGRKTIFYVPDLVYIRQRHAALKGIKVYIGDGARIRYPLVRTKGTRTVGHTSIYNQLHWCQIEHVPLAIFTHCGSEIVTKPGQSAEKIGSLCKKFGTRAKIAYDGMKIWV